MGSAAAAIRKVGDGSDATTFGICYRKKHDFLLDGYSSSKKESTLILKNEEFRNCFRQQTHVLAKEFHPDLSNKKAQVS